MISFNKAKSLLTSGPSGIEEWNALRARRADAVSLSGICLTGAELGDCNLSKINLAEADLRGADLRRVNFRSTSLVRARLCRANLSNARLQYADLGGADLGGAILDGAELMHAMLGYTLIACDLSKAVGLNDTIHYAPSNLTIESILSFHGEVPEQFLRGCGIRSEELGYFQSRLRHEPRFYSCFISYSTFDEEFATKLHHDFQKEGIVCWKWNHDAQTGRALWSQIDVEIKEHDKVVLIASKHALTSPAVMRELERTLRQEDERARFAIAKGETKDTDVLFPISLDEFLYSEWKHERKADVLSKVVTNVGNWKTEPENYKRMLARLLRDLTRPTRGIRAMIN